MISMRFPRPPTPERGESCPRFLPLPSLAVTNGTGLLSEIPVWLWLVTQALQPVAVGAIAVVIYQVRELTQAVLHGPNNLLDRMRTSEREGAIQLRHCMDLHDALESRLLRLERGTS